MRKVEVNVQARMSNAEIATLNSGIHPERTAKYRNDFSAPMQWCINRYLIGNSLSRVKTVLDYGCGYGDDVFNLYTIPSISPYGYEMYNHTVRWSPLIHRGIDEPYGPFDLVTCTFVLCVIPTKDERFKVIRKVLRRSHHFSVFTVRTDPYEYSNARHFLDGVVTQRQTFQHRFEHLELEQMLREVTDTIPKEYRLETHKIRGAEICVAISV